MRRAGMPRFSRWRAAPAWMCTPVAPAHHHGRPGQAKLTKARDPRLQFVDRRLHVLDLHLPLHAHVGRLLGQALAGVLHALAGVLQRRRWLGPHRRRRRQARAQPPVLVLQHGLAGHRVAAGAADGGAGQTPHHALAAVQAAAGDIGSVEPAERQPEGRVLPPEYLS